MTVNTAVHLCEDVGGALTQIADGYNYYNERINTAGYQYFYVFSTGNVFLSQFYDLYKDDIRNYEYHRFANRIYAFALPVPHNRAETDQISIEHYFTDNEIKTEIDGKRLFLGNEFYPTGVYMG